MDKELLDILEEILQNGYKIELTKNTIKILETYKSECRDKYMEKVAYEALGRLEYFKKGTRRITVERLKGSGIITNLI